MSFPSLFIIVTVERTKSLEQVKNSRGNIFQLLWLVLMLKPRIHKEGGNVAPPLTSDF